MPAKVKIDECEWHIQMLKDGVILVQHAGCQHNPLHGPGTSGNFEFFVHPCQRHQYEFLNSQLPPAERASGQSEQAASERPWWSSVAGERAGLRE